MDLKKIVKEAFKNASEDLMNGETAVNMVVSHNKGVATVAFDIDLGRGGIDSYGDSYVKFSSKKIECRLGESLEGCGIERMVEESLEQYIGKIVPPLKRTLSKSDMKPRVMLSTADFIKFIDKNSTMEWNEICDFVNEKGYLSEECESAYGETFGNTTPNKERVKDHGFDYEYEFLKAHPELETYEVSLIFDD